MSKRPPPPPITHTERLRAATLIVRTLRDAGHEAYFAGGYPRDRLLGRVREDGEADIDIATAATPDEVEALFKRTVPVGRQFGVIQVVQPASDRRGDRRRIAIEVATFRAEADYADGRRPSHVEFASAEADVKRRDFTINGMLFDPLTDETIDLVGGRADLDARLIRAIGDPHERIGEDRLRMMRAVRFAAELGFAIEPATLTAVSAHAAALEVVSAERIRVELLKTLRAPHGHDGLALLHTTGLLAVFLPEIAAAPVFDIVSAAFQARAADPALRALDSEGFLFALLLHAIEPRPSAAYDLEGLPDFPAGERAAEIARRLRAPNGAADRARALIAHHGQFHRVHDLRESGLKRLLRQEPWSEHVGLFRLACRARRSAGIAPAPQPTDRSSTSTPPQAGEPPAHHLEANADYCEDRRMSIANSQGDAGLHPPKLLTGMDLMALGYEPGPAFALVLSLLEDAQLENSVRNRTEAEAFVRKAFSEVCGSGSGPIAAYRPYRAP